MDEGGEAHLRREALQIALQLPTDKRDAIRVLKLAEHLVKGFLAGFDGEPQPPLRPPVRLI